MERDPDDLFMFVPDKPDPRCGPIIIPDQPPGTTNPNWLGEHVINILRQDEER